MLSSSDVPPCPLNFVPGTTDQSFSVKSLLLSNYSKPNLLLNATNRVNHTIATIVEEANVSNEIAAVMPTSVLEEQLSGEDSVSTAYSLKMSVVRHEHGFSCDCQDIDRRWVLMGLLCPYPLKTQLSSITRAA